MPDIDNYKILSRSVTKGDYPTTPYEGGVLTLRIPLNSGSKLPLPPQILPYWSFQRDAILRQTVHTEPMWAGAIGIAITKMAAMGWQVESKVGLRQRRAHELLLNAGGVNIGWVQFLSRHLRDFLTTDNGAFVEIIRATRAEGSRIIGIKHLDSSRCLRTGDPKVPVLYYDRKGKVHELKDYQIVAISDMPDPSDTYYGVGLCAASRAYSEIFKLCAMEWYIREKVTGLTPLAIHIVNGVLDKQIRGAVDLTKSEKEAQGVVSFMGATIIGTPSDSAPNLVTIPLAELPDRFDRKEEFDMALLAYANALGVDVQDLQPLSGGSLGTGTQSQVLHEKGLGKGLSAWRQAFGHQINMYLLDESTTFTFIENDTRDKQAAAGVSNSLATVSSTRIGAKITTPAQELRWLIEKDELPREFLPLTDKIQPEGSIDDNEKPEWAEEGLLAVDVPNTIQDMTGTGAPLDLGNPSTLPIPEKTDAQIQSEQNEMRRGTLQATMGAINENRQRSFQENDKKSEREQKLEDADSEQKRKIELMKTQAQLQAEQKKAELKKVGIKKKELREEIYESFVLKGVAPTQEQLDLAEALVRASYEKQTVKVRKFNQELSPEIKEINDKVKVGIIESLKGGPGSGNFGHAGRPGKVGGSSPASSKLQIDGKLPVDTSKRRDTYSTYRNQDGSWTPERKALHDKIINSFFEGKTPVENPVSFVMGGGPASGKSSLAELGLLNIDPNHVTANADSIKEMLPEYKAWLNNGDLSAAAFVHEESSYLSKEIVNKAIAEGYNVMLDGTGNNSLESMLKKIEKLKRNGRTVNAIYATVSIKVALDRNIDRAKKTGRFVPESFIKQSHKSVSSIFPALAKAGVVNSLKLYDTENGVKLIASQEKNGTINVLDKTLYSQFLDKARE